MNQPRLLLVYLFVALVGCEQTTSPSTTDSQGEPQLPVAVVEEPRDHKQPAEPPQPVVLVVEAARQQIGVTVTYDGAYVGLSYPGGDVPSDRGVCTDVVIRALRDAHDYDLQQRVHEDMKASFAAYPTIWGLKKPDRNIDHRRVPNLQTYFRRQGYALQPTHDAANYMPGDLVTCTVGKNQPHIMIVSDRKSADGVPLVIHNIGRGTQEEDRLFEFPLTGHYRIATAESDTTPPAPSSASR